MAPDLVPSPSGECRCQKADPEPRADVGILLVHGIGDHKEGETLTAFGEPLLDWMRDWLRGDGKRTERGVLTVTEARLKTEGAPAFALAEVSAPDVAHAGFGFNLPPSSERWLVCEGWWGGSVQAPPSWNLLLWMWSRTPLLVYWHFYVIGDSRGYRQDSLGYVFLLVPAFLLASIGQLAVSIAMVLWLIPFGPWRKGVIAVVRALTLTLGDSFVLIGQEIQHAALVERVRRSLEWLADRTERVVVVAHSQGGAIAHEALLRGAPSKVAGFISVGSGLEKLQFLRAVIDRRSGMLASALILPCGLLTIGLISIASDSGAAWQTGLAWVSAAFMLILGVGAFAEFSEYRKEASRSVGELQLAPASGIRWLDLYATRDAVPMGRGSLLRQAAFVTQSAVFNEGSFLGDHLTYFTNANDCLHRVWLEIARHSRLALFRGDDRDRLEYFSRLHVRFGRLFAFSRFMTVVATFILGALLRHQLFGFGQSVLAAVHGTPVAEWLKPVQAMSSGLAWLLDHWWPGAASADDLTQSIFGLALLVGGIALWWSSFRAFWSWRRHRRWRAVARGSGVERAAIWRVAGGANLCLFFLLGAVPLIVVVVTYLRPELLTFESIGQIVARIFSLFLVVIAFFYVVIGPLFDSNARTKQIPIRGIRLLMPVAAPLLALLILAAARGLWPAPLSGEAQNAVFTTAAACYALVWQVYAVRVHRAALGVTMTALVVILPIVGALASPYVYESGRVLTYAAATALVIGTAFVYRHWRQMPQMIRELWSRAS